MSEAEENSEENPEETDEGGETSLKNSVAFHVLDELARDGEIPMQQMEILKDRYGRQHECVLQIYENEKKFLSTAKELNTKLMAEKIKMEKALLEAEDNQNQVNARRVKIRELDKQLEAALDDEATYDLKAQELEAQHRELVEQIAAKKAAEQAAFRPLVENMESTLHLQKEEIAQLNITKKEKEAQKDADLERVAQLRDDLETTHVINMEQHERELNKIKNEPGRVKKQVEKFETVLKSMKAADDIVQEDLKKTDARTEELIKKRKKVEDQRSKATLRVQLMKDSVVSVNDEYSEIQRKLERLRNTSADLLAKKVGIDMETRIVSEDIRHGLDEKTKKEQQLERQKRDYRRKEMAVKELRHQIPPLIARKKELDEEIQLKTEDNKKQILLLDEIQNEVDVFIGAFLKQESVEKEKKEELSSLHQGLQDLRQDLANLKRQNSDWGKHLRFVEQAHGKLVRDLQNATVLSKEVWDNVQMKQLEEFDLRKKLAEVTERQKEFCAAYEVVKNERNKYVALIQAASQKLSEMRERFKVLGNEIEILRLESAGKDKTITETQQQTKKQRAVRDAYRLELTRILHKINQANENVELYVLEIDQLNALINTLEREITVAKQKFEDAVCQRNQTGIQLIDRNDELCILWEKSNVQELLLKKGEMAIQQKMENLRSCRIDLAALNRRMVSMNRSIQDTAQYTEKVLILKDQLRGVKRQSDALSAELENPSSKVRKWRFLGEGQVTDPDKDTLMAKRQWLEERLNAKEEQLLEKELIVEEVTALSEKLRVQAIDGRQATLKMSQRVNAFQAKMKEVTRQMMATVSELSMYQATSMKLSEEANLLRDAAAEARARLRENQPPTATAEEELQKLVQLEAQRAADQERAKARMQEEVILHSNVTRTTAEPRVNAYIPEGAYGLPKAYGKHTPFMPQAGGATMRHIRNPNPKPVEI
ncbi:unnamed protein product [Amoebophrya sp. A120]|nr:unnamed protein product [Amoebophrya sp. A120]|eukprot:GSA120T00011720001.1